MGRSACPVLARVSGRYAACGRFARGYVAGKLKGDPIHRDVLALAKREPFGNVLDVGGGRGQLGIALLEAGLAQSVLALDRSEARLAQARRAGAGLAFAAEAQDFARLQQLPPTDTVLLIDVLYQLDPATRDALLEAVARAARRLVLIRALDPARGLRSALTLGYEHVARFTAPHSGPRMRAMPLSRIVAGLHDAGFTVAVAPCWRGTPFANVLLTARR